MTLFLFYCTIVLTSLGLIGAASQKTSHRALTANQSDDRSLLKPMDAAYAEAMEFAQFLRNKGIGVQSVHRSKLETFFREVNKAAFFRTDKGVLEVIFFPGPAGAEKVHVTEKRTAGRYIYSFKGQRNPQPNEVFDGNRPMYFLMHRNLFVVTDDDKLHKELRHVFADESR